MNERDQFACQCVEHRAVRNKRSRQLSREAVQGLTPKEVTTRSGIAGVQRHFDCALVSRVSERRGADPTSTMFGCPELGGEAKKFVDAHLGRIASAKASRSRLDLKRNPTTRLDTPNPLQLERHAIRGERDDFIACPHSRGGRCVETTP